MSRNWLVDGYYRSLPVSPLLSSRLLFCCLECRNWQLDNFIPVPAFCWLVSAWSPLGKTWPDTMMTHVFGCNWRSRQHQGSVFFLDFPSAFYLVTYIKAGRAGGSFNIDNQISWFTSRPTCWKKSINSDLIFNFHHQYYYYSYSYSRIIHDKVLLLYSIHYSYCDFTEMNVTEVTDVWMLSQHFKGNWD